jgi:hypothetical protein
MEFAGKNLKVKQKRQRRIFEKCAVEEGTAASGARSVATEPSGR